MEEIVFPLEEQEMLGVYDALHLVGRDFRDNIEHARHRAYAPQVNARATFYGRTDEEIKQNIIEEIEEQKQIGKKISFPVTATRIQVPKRLSPYEEKGKLKDYFPEDYLPYDEKEKLKDYVRRQLDEFRPELNIHVDGIPTAMLLMDNLSALINFVNNIPAEYVPEQYKEWLVDEDRKEPDSRYSDVLGLGGGYKQRVVEAYLYCRDNGLSSREFAKKTGLSRSRYHQLKRDAKLLRLRFF